MHQLTLTLQRSKPTFLSRTRDRSVRHLRPLVRPGDRAAVCDGAPERCCEESWRERVARASSATPDAPSPTGVLRVDVRCFVFLCDGCFRDGTLLCVLEQPPLSLRANSSGTILGIAPWFAASLATAFHWTRPSMNRDDARRYVARSVPLPVAISSHHMANRTSHIHPLICGLC